jgi:hypothetical protein
MGTVSYAYASFTSRFLVLKRIDLTFFCFLKSCVDKKKVLRILINEKDEEIDVQYVVHERFSIVTIVFTPKSDSNAMVTFLVHQ